MIYTLCGIWKSVSTSHNTLVFLALLSIQKFSRCMETVYWIWHNFNGVCLPECPLWCITNYYKSSLIHRVLLWFLLSLWKNLLLHGAPVCLYLNPGSHFHSRSTLVLINYEIYLRTITNKTTLILKNLWTGQLYNIPFKRFQTSSLMLRYLLMCQKSG